jgi:hypothetical protein
MDTKNVVGSEAVAEECLKYGQECNPSKAKVVKDKFGTKHAVPGEDTKVTRYTISTLTCPKTKAILAETAKITHAIDLGVTQVRPKFMGDHVENKPTESMSTPKKTMVTLRKAAKICMAMGLGVTYRMLREWVLKGYVKVAKVGNWSYVNIEALIADIKNPNSALYQQLTPDTTATRAEQNHKQGISAKGTKWRN